MRAKGKLDLKALQPGEAEAFRRLVREYGPTIRAWIGQHVRDPQVIDDLAQETLIAAWDSLADHRGESLPVLMLTAKGQRIDRETALECGADLFMTKPFANAEITAAVTQLADGGSD